MTRRLDAGILFRDFLFLMLLAMLLLINPPAADSTTSPPGNIMASIAWPEGNDDVDLWCRAPDDTLAVGYSNRAGKQTNLVRDDLGNSGDDGPLNYENCYMRGLRPGEYVVNLHGFRLRGNVPVYVEVRVGGYGERMALVWEGTIELRNKQELTAVRFRLDANGALVAGSVTNIYKALRQ
jgi:hypothetical protein